MDCFRRCPEPDKETFIYAFGWATEVLDLVRGQLKPFGLKSEQLFWIDTLCVPVGVQHAALRMKAINQMAPIYACASQVVVLDSELQQVTTSNADAHEVLARVMTCGWIGRSRTLQEGALARSCLFQFADTVTNPVGGEF